MQLYFLRLLKCYFGRKALPAAVHELWAAYFLFFFVFFQATWRVNARFLRTGYGSLRRMVGIPGKVLSKLF